MKKYAIASTIIIILFFFSLLTKNMWINIFNYEKYIAPFSKFSCKGFNNISETYKVNCTLPVDNKPFEFTEHLDCQTLTSHQFYTNKDNDPYREQITSIKSDYLKFNLDFKGKELVRSLDTGKFPRKEDYVIVKDSNGVIQAMRPMKKEHIDKEYQYEFITFSKNTGHGMELWHNVKSNIENEPWRDDTIGSHFFKCK